MGKCCLCMRFPTVDAVQRTLNSLQKLRNVWQEVKAKIYSQPTAQPRVTDSELLKKLSQTQKQEMSMQELKQLYGTASYLTVITIVIHYNPFYHHKSHLHHLIVLSKKSTRGRVQVGQITAAQRYAFRFKTKKWWHGAPETTLWTWTPQTIKAAHGTGSKTR